MLSTLQSSLMSVGLTQIAMIQGPQSSQGFALVNVPRDAGIELKDFPIDTWVKVSGYTETDLEPSSAILRMGGMPNTEETRSMYRRARSSLQGEVTWGRINVYQDSRPTLLRVAVNMDRPHENLRQGLTTAVMGCARWGGNQVAWDFYDRSLGVNAIRTAKLLLESVRLGWDLTPDLTSDIHIYRVYDQPKLFASLVHLLGATEV